MKRIRLLICQIKTLKYGNFLIFLGVFFIFCLLFALLAQYRLSAKDRAISSIIKNYSFTPIVPPSTLISPGAIVAVISEYPFIAGVICPSNDNLGSDVTSGLLVSGSASSKEASELLTGDFKLETSIQDQITSTVQSKYISSIEVTLSNVRIIEIPDTKIFEYAKSRKTACSQAIQFRQNKGQKITMIKSVIQATAIYNIHFKGGLDVKTRTKTTADIASFLGLHSQTNSECTIEGANLIWGVRDDANLVSISSTELPKTGSSSQRQILPLDSAIKVISNDQQ